MTFSSPTSYADWSPSSSKSNRSSPVHPASQVDPETHSPELMQLVDITLSKPVIAYIVDSVSETVDYAFNRPAHAPRSPFHRRFTKFVGTVLSRAEVTPSTVLVALAYIARARPHLSIALEEWALERVFLGALVVASKYTQDSTLRNVHWAMCTGVFGKGDIGRIEREFLEVLDWDLGVREAELLAHHEGLLGAAAGVRARMLPPALPAKTEVEEVAYIKEVDSPMEMDVDVDAHTTSPLHSHSVPELSGSPHSSAATLSPRTPVSHVMSVPPSPMAFTPSPPAAASVSATTLVPSSTPAPSLRLARCPLPTLRGPAKKPTPTPAPPNGKANAHAHAHGHGRLHTFLHALHSHNGHHGHHHTVQLRA
ncbi:hypothetical protein C8R47DRAFT_1080074 [Mycena vitilis]|nr:hypothetical protein C8R47DRAFT_1080074 [Mycena vitilis]